MPFCTQCGVENPASARFCDQCGAPLVQVTNAPPAPVAAPTVAAPVAPATPATPAAPAAQPALSAGPTVCPQCGTAAIPGEAFCDNCGAPLSAPQRPAATVPTPPYSPGLAPQPNYPPPQPAQPAQPVAPPSYGAAPAAPPSYAQPAQPAQPVYTPPVQPAQPAQPVYTPPVQPAQPARTSLAPARLVAVATGAAMALPATAQAIIGRADPVSQFRPDLDLTAYGALEQGVGRRHVRLFVQDGQIMVEDMDSTNGSQVNGQRLPPRQPRALRDGDQLQLGRLVLRIQL
ncbi:MAG: zinc ribbon domain-containing protein [Roseiflexaceae bacterium]